MVRSTWTPSSNMIGILGNGRSSGHMVRMLHRPVKTKRRSASAPSIPAFEPLQPGKFYYVYISTLTMNMINLCTFIRYSPTRGHGCIGKNDIQRIIRLLLALDNLISRTTQAPARRRGKFRRAQARMRQRVKDLVNECHKKSVVWLLETFDVIIIPRFNAHSMAGKRKRRLNRQMVRKMLTWSHGRFLNRLLSKAEELGKKIVIVSEAYTSKTCSACGWVDQHLGGKKVFACRRCGWVVDRDVNGARGIFLRGLLFLEELANQEGPNEGFA
jgi:IS605 OrfB family transposase